MAGDFLLLYPAKEKKPSDSWQPNIFYQQILETKGGVLFPYKLPLSRWLVTCVENRPFYGGCEIDTLNL